MKLCEPPTQRHDPRTLWRDDARAADVAGVVVTSDTSTGQWLVVGGGSLEAARAPPWRFHSVSSHPWIKPLSPHTGHCHTMCPEVRSHSAMMSPRQRRRPGLRRQGTFVCQSPSGKWSVTHATIDPKKSARLSTGVGRSSGRSPPCPRPGNAAYRRPSRLVSRCRHSGMKGVSHNAGALTVYTKTCIVSCVGQAAGVARECASRRPRVSRGRPPPQRLPAPSGPARTRPRRLEADARYRSRRSRDPDSDGARTPRILRRHVRGSGVRRARVRETDPKNATTRVEAGARSLSRIDEREASGRCEKQID